MQPSQLLVSRVAATRTSSDLKGSGWEPRKGSHPDLLQPGFVRRRIGRREIVANTGAGRWTAHPHQCWRLCRVTTRVKYHCCEPSSRTCSSRLQNLRRHGLNMRRLCSWCSDTLEGSSASPSLTTHGICAPCARKLLASIADSSGKALARRATKMLEGARPKGCDAISALPRAHVIRR
jgi:hypothetical protein